MRRGATALVGAVAIAGLAGCGLAPYADESLPPLEEHGLRITQGFGTGSEYQAAIEVYPGSTVQVLTEIADGKTAIVTIPRGPAAEIEVTVRVEGDPDAGTASSTMRSGTGEPIAMHRLFEFDPGYIGVEDQSDEEALRLRIATPRLTGTGQGQVPFTFKTKAR